MSDQPATSGTSRGVVIRTALGLVVGLGLGMLIQAPSNESAEGSRKEPPHRSKQNGSPPLSAAEDSFVRKSLELDADASCWSGVKLSGVLDLGSMFLSLVSHNNIYKRILSYSIW